MEHHPPEPLPPEPRPAAGGQARRSRRLPYWGGGLAALAALAAVIMLVAVGCGDSTPSASPLVQGDGLSPGTGGIVSPPPARASRKPARKPISMSLRSGVNGGVLFGGSVPLLGVEGQLGRRLAIVRVYYTIGQKFSNANVRGYMASGSTLLASLDTIPGGPTYAAIAAGREDGTISGFLASMEQSAITYHLNAIYICFEHEADDPGHHYGLGSPAQFVQAWDHIHQLAEAAHLDWNQGGRLHWVMILTHLGYIHGLASQFWPGTSEADIVGVDGYNAAAHCRTARAGTNVVASGTAMETPPDLFDAALSFASSQGGLPVFIAEFGSIPYTSPAIQPDFISQMEQFVIGHPQIGAALYWDGHGQGNGCNYIIDNTPASLAALARMGGAPMLQGSSVSG